jgi:PilZ domain-containing protein
MVSIPGKYSLTSRRDTQGNRREFACRVVSMSARVIVLATPVSGAIGERVIAHIDRFGKLEGTISRIMDRGFVLTLTVTEDERNKLVSKILWLEKHQNHELPEGRQHGRIIPKDPHSTLILADGTRVSCLVIDMSVSGAAVSADIIPEIGMPLAIGRAVGRVVRRFGEGFAVQFVTPQSIGTLEQTVICR